MAAADGPETAARRVDADGVGSIRERVRGTKPTISQDEIDDLLDG